MGRSECIRHTPQPRLRSSRGWGGPRSAGRDDELRAVRIGMYRQRPSDGHLQAKEERVPEPVDREDDPKGQNVPTAAQLSTGCRDAFN